MWSEDWSRTEPCPVTPPAANSPSTLATQGNRRKETKAIVMQALGDRVEDTGAIAAILLQLRPDFTLKQAHQRVYMVRWRLARRFARHPSNRPPLLGHFQPSIAKYCFSESG